MRITELRIENFRSVRSLILPLGKTTVLIGQNNAGKTAIVDALRMVLSRRWGQRGTGFTENDVHRPKPDDDPRTLPPVSITLVLEEQDGEPWHTDVIQDLANFTRFKGTRRRIALQVTCAWDKDLKTFDPSWQFLNDQDEADGERRRSINFASAFFNYLPLSWQGALRDADSEFSVRSGYWGSMLKAIQIPDALEAEVVQSLAALDEKIIEAAPRLSEIAAMVGEATRVAIGDGPGSAKVNTLPLSVEEMLQRAGIVMRNESLLPWLPLGHHGQGLQSLATIFLQQAAMQQRLIDQEIEAAQPIFAIEEAEAHLHPQAARTLWSRLSALAGQKILTTHSPHFLHHVPLRDIRLVRIRNGQTEVSSIPSRAVSTLPWNDDVAGWVNGSDDAKGIFEKDPFTNTVAAKRWFDTKAAARLKQCFKGEDPQALAQKAAAAKLQEDARVLPSEEDERHFSFHGRRLRGEIMFARRWVLVEGVSEYLLTHAIADAFKWQLDDHGVSVIDYQFGDGPAACAGLADAFEIPWYMVGDGKEKDKLTKNLKKRGFSDALLADRLGFHPERDLEAQLVSDGNQEVLKEICNELRVANADQLDDEQLADQLRGQKTAYMGRLADRVVGSLALAKKMPKVIVDHIKELSGSEA